MSNCNNLEVKEEDTDVNVFKILMATDNHLGYGEKLPIRGEDSFNTFEEILQIAAREKVDFILLGGDLFHDCKPTPYSMLKCSELIKKYCFGDKPIKIEFLSDQSYHFSHLKNPIVNYEDPNLNVSIPIFSIHGNHDDPTGVKSISPLDLLSTNGLVNYFGRHNDLNNIEVQPMLMRKGNTKLAIYGFSHIHDQRLVRLFQDQKVTLSGPGDDWFHLLVLHQNRVIRGVKNSISVSWFPKFLNLIMWGHEHDCKIDPVIEDDIFITQPGSSIATSLAAGESLEKYVGVLRIKDSTFQIQRIKLRTVRPFVFHTLELNRPSSTENESVRGKSRDSFDDIGMNPTAKAAVKQVEKEIEKILKDIQEEREAEGLTSRMLPLVRLIVRYVDERQVFNSIRLGQQYIGRVANPEDIILIKPKVVYKGKNKRPFLMDDEDLQEIETAQEVTDNIGELVKLELEKSGKLEKMDILSINGLQNALNRFVTTNDNEALGDLIQYQMYKTIEILKEMNVDDDASIGAAINELYEKRISDEKNETDELNKVFDNPTRKKLSNTTIEDDDDIVSLIDDDDDASSNINGNAGNVSVDKPARGRGSRGGRGAQRGGRGTRGRRAAKA